MLGAKMSVKGARSPRTLRLRAVRGVFPRSLPGVLNMSATLLLVVSAAWGFSKPDSRPTDCCWRRSLPYAHSTIPSHCAQHIQTPPSPSQSARPPVVSLAQAMARCQWGSLCV